ncbi:caspase domain-containing protein [Prosthecobacter sp.]|uniref:caspase domain-containing protein n=1 Tax=Prosthecobacter sp. TaxID=1965333 RepID=UPI003783F4CC
MKAVFHPLSHLILFTALCATAWAQPSGGGRHALILCNQNYQAIGPLRTTLAEAREAEKTLAGLGFAGHITVVTDATTAKMTEAVDTFAAKTAGAEVALFFYGGHAIQAGGENYLLGVDSDPATSSQLAYKALPLGRVLTDLEGSGSRLNLFILDCCRDNPLPTRGRNVGGVRGMAAVANAPKGTFIAYAADANQQAWDDHGSIGLYGSVLFEKMKTPGLRLEDIFIQTREEVSKIATEKYQHQQEPAEYSKVSGAFYFSKDPQGSTIPVTIPSAVTNTTQPIGTAVQMTSINAEKITMLLRGGDGGVFQIQQLKPQKSTCFKQLGETFDFNRNSITPRYKITSTGRRVESNPTLGAMDVYTVKVFDSVSGKEFELIQGKETEVP